MARDMKTRLGADQINDAVMLAKRRGLPVRDYLDELTRGDEVCTLSCAIEKAKRKDLAANREGTDE